MRLRDLWHGDGDVARSWPPQFGGALVPGARFPLGEVGKIVGVEAAKYIVDLEEGVRMNAQMRLVSPDEMRIGLPVKVTFERTKEGLTLPAFVRTQ